MPKTSSFPVAFKFVSTLNQREKKNSHVSEKLRKERLTAIIIEIHHAFVFSLK